MRIHHTLLAPVLAAFAALALAGCITWSDFHHNPSSIEGWLTTSTPAHAWTPVEPERQINLPATSVSTAATLLTHHAAIQLDPERFGQLVPGRQWPSQTGRVPYLVRGVALDEPRGSLRVLEYDDEILVQYEGPPARARAIPMPVIVLMPAAPAKLYVKISMFD
jgi:hypothetical protein